MRKGAYSAGSAPPASQLQHLSCTALPHVWLRLLMLPPLPCPVPLCRDNLEVFRQNGFYFKDDPANGRLLLAAVPFRCSSMLPPVGQL